MVKKKQEENNADFRALIRIAGHDINGNKPLMFALTKIRGVSYSYSNAICEILGLKKDMKSGVLTDEDVNKLETFLSNPEVDKLPTWILNRRNDPINGETTHLVGSDMRFRIENDIKAMRKLKTYKGIRHALGLPLRGQKTKSNFRRTKVLKNRKTKKR